jgi:hypothetical protein
MQDLLPKLQKRLPSVSFEAGDTFCWSPTQDKLIYNPASKHAKWSLLHETAHALLGHKAYNHDVELLLLEVEAWETAKQLGEELGEDIHEDHIQDCLDTYRDWLHQRSTCPRCGCVSLQLTAAQYQCHNCVAIWNVSASRFCRPYRFSGRPTKKSPKAQPQAIFQ